MKWLYMFLVLVGGVGVGIQAGVNSALGKRIGSLEGSLISFTVGTLALLLITLFLGKGELLSVFSAPKWQLTGGLLGALYVFLMVWLVPKLGTASALIAVIAGQMLAASLIDHFGLMGGRQIPLNGYRIAGLLLMAAAVLLFNRQQ